MNIALAQINPVLGDFEYNLEEITQKVLEASKKGAELVIFSELATFGYMPSDLLERPDIVEKQILVIKKAIKKFPKDIAVLFGAVMPHQDLKERYYNSAVFVYESEIKSIFFKELLPNYDVFDEKRFFKKGELKENILNFRKKKFLISICEDLWFDESGVYENNPMDGIKEDLDYIINLSASPFTKNKLKTRKKILKNIALTQSATSIYVNQVGAQDELIFDGGSFAFDSKGKEVSQLSLFKTDLKMLDEKKEKISKDEYENIFNALVLGLRDYFKKTGFKKALLGLSGGIDSGLVLMLAKEALGAENVTGYALPGPYSSKLSMDLAKEISKNLGTHLEIFDVNPTYDVFLKSFDEKFGDQDFGLMHENLQARLRALTLMALSNKNGSLLLATSNKSELCVGYSTLYGDQCGALMPIGDLLKTEVFKLCEWYNRFKGSEVIPVEMIKRPPTAELRPNQKDEDSLPPYEELDQTVDKLITKKGRAKTDQEKWVLKRSFQSEFKRWQAAPILKISEHAFGRGRRMPLAHKTVIY